MIYLGLLIGFCVGLVAGIILMAICVAAKEAI